MGDDAQLTHAFEAELMALRRGGRALGERQPLVAGALTTEARDPDIERLLGGLAYLTATTKLYHERRAPHFVLELLGLLAPQLAEPEPARALVQLALERRGARPYLVLPKGHELQGEAHDGELFFTTEREAVIWPLQLRSSFVVPREGRAEWTLALEGPVAGIVDDAGPACLELHIARPWPEAATLLLALSAHLKELRCTIGAHSFALPVGALAPSRLGTFDAPVHTRANALPPGLAHVRRFYSQPQQVAFFGLDLAAVRRALGAAVDATDLRGAQSLTLQLVLEDAAELPLQLPADAVRLSVVPVANCAVRDAMPVRLEGLATSHPLRAEGLAPGRSQVLGVLEATLSHPHMAGRKALSPAGQGEPGAPSYQVSRTAHPRDGWHDAQISVVGKRPLVAGEVLSARVRVSQRTAADALPPGARLGSTIERTSIRATLVGPVSSAQDVCIAQDHAADAALWRLVGLMPGRQQQRSDAEAMRELLACATSFAPGDETGRSTLARHLRAIFRSEESTEHQLVRGALLPVRAVSFAFDSTLLGSIGEAFCLASLLDNLLADGQGVGELQKVAFVGPQRRYTLAPRSHHKPLGRIRLT